MSGQLIYVADERVRRPSLRNPLRMLLFLSIPECDSVEDFLS